MVMIWQIYHLVPPYILFKKICDHCLHDLRLYIENILSYGEMVNFKKWDFL